MSSTLTFHKRDGNAAGEVRVCTFDANGKHDELKTFELPKDSPDGKGFSVTVPMNHVFTLIVDGCTRDVRSIPSCKQRDGR